MRSDANRRSVSTVRRLTWLSAQMPTARSAVRNGPSVALVTLPRQSPSACGEELRRILAPLRTPPLLVLIARKSNHAMTNAHGRRWAQCCGGNCRNRIVLPRFGSRRERRIGDRGARAGFRFFFPMNLLIALSVNFSVLVTGLIASSLASDGFCRLRRDKAALRELDPDTVCARSPKTR